VDGRKNRRKERWIDGSKEERLKGRKERWMEERKNRKGRWKAG
jgi:hypothetical protein